MTAKIKVLGKNNYNSNDIMFEVLKNRKLNKDILEANEESMPSPYDFENMEEAVNMIVKHINNNSKIRIIQDSDPDGLTSSCIIYNRIKAIKNDIDLEMIIHDKRTHGIVLKELDIDNIDLLIVPDGGSDNYKEHKILKEKGVDVLVIDHHDVDKRSEYALIVNNNIDKKYTQLSGAGMVYLVCKAIDDDMWEDGFSDKYLDLVALGIISDMMLINNNYNQYIIDVGLQNINNKGFMAMVDSQSFSIGDEITPKDISFSITPLINSVFRLGTVEQKKELFKSFCELDNETYIYNITRGKNKGEEREESFYDKTARMCKSLNNKRKNLGKKIVKETKIDLDNKILFVELDEKYGKDGMSRILANSLARDNMKPCLVYCKNSEGKYKGSMSSGDVIDNFKDRLNELDIFKFVAGHQAASGFELIKDKIPVSQKILNNKFSDEHFEKVVDIDFDIPYNDFMEVGDFLIDDISEYNTKYGRGFDIPLIRINNIVLKVCKENVDLIGSKKNTIKFKLSNDIELLLFFTNKDFYNDLISFNEYLKLNIIGECSINEFKGKRTRQITIKDIENLNETETEIFDEGW